MPPGKDYDTTVARVAGNLLSSSKKLWYGNGLDREKAVFEAVATARDIVAEVKRTEPPVAFEGVQIPKPGSKHGEV